MPQRTILRWLVVVVAGASGLALAADYASLSGQYKLGGKTLYDPPHDEPQDTHIYFELGGHAAKDLYASMKVAPKRGVCGESGSLTKRIGGTQCTRSGGEYHCWFGIDVRNQRVVNAVTC